MKSEFVEILQPRIALEIKWHHERYLMNTSQHLLASTI
jgi:hypothetical protein